MSFHKSKQRNNSIIFIRKNAVSNIILENVTYTMKKLVNAIILALVVEITLRRR